MLDHNQIRSQFPQLNVKVRGRDLVYLDNAATTLKPQRVIQRLSDYYSEEVANVHRGAHFLSDQGTKNYEGARQEIANFIGAKSAAEVIFSRGTTESLNLVAQSFGRTHLKSGDVILLTEMEHHSNIVPWQIVAQQTGAKIEVVKILDNGEIDRQDFAEKLKLPVKIFAVTWVSNVLGTINPIEELLRQAKHMGAWTVVDAAQAVSILPISVRDLDCDFLAFSGHKVFGPTGIGILYGKEELLNKMPPYQGGGSMISRVSFQQSEYLPAPQRFEAGTPHVSGALGLAESIKFLKELDFKELRTHEKSLVDQTLDVLKKRSKVRLIGESDSRVNVVSFVYEGIHASDLGQLLDQQGLAVRAGHHCCEPLMRRFGVNASLRLSFSIYNHAAEIEAFDQALSKCEELLL